MGQILQDSTTTKTKRCDLLAVSKSKPIDSIISAYYAGQRIFGENYVEEFSEKAQALKHLDIKWHFIGHLQSRKCRALVSNLNLAMIESLDSQKLADTLNKECSRIQREPVSVLV